MNELNIWLALVGMAIVTFLTRAIGVFALGGAAPQWIQRWLGYVPVAVFTALVVPALLVQNSSNGAQFVVGPGVAAGLIGAVVAWRTNNVMATIVVGMLAFWVLRWLGM